MDVGYPYLIALRQSCPSSASKGQTPPNRDFDSLRHSRLPLAPAAFAEIPNYWQATQKVGLFLLAFFSCFWRAFSASPPAAARSKLTFTFDLEFRELALLGFFQFFFAQSIG